MKKTMPTIREQLIELFYDNNVHCDQTIEHLVDDVVDIIKNSNIVLPDTVKSTDATEYVERDETVRKALDACIKVVGHGISHIDAVDIAEIMDSIPAADVVGVRHGEWDWYPDRIDRQELLSIAPLN